MEKTAAILLRDVIRRLHESSIPFEKLSLSDEVEIVVMQHGGRILGPFTGVAKESLLWMHPSWSHDSSWREFLSQNHWNIGGERLWIAPELQFCIMDRSDIAGSYNLPRSMDPADYSLSRPSPDIVRLNTDMILDTFNSCSGRQNLSITREITLAENPLRRLHRYEELMRQVRYCGYTHRIKLEMLSPSPMVSESWDILQVNQGGTAILPVPSDPQFGWYYVPNSPDSVRIGESITTAHMAPGHLFKFGIHSAFWCGRVAYLHHSKENGQWSLMVRAYFVNPSGTYTEEPFDSPGDNGYAFHIYNSMDMFERFGELESHGQAVGGSTGRTSSTDEMITWFFLGASTRLFDIAAVLLPSAKSQLASVWPQPED